MISLISSIISSPLSFSELKEILLKNEKKNLELKGYIISHTKFENKKYLNLNIQMKENSCKEFIYYDTINSIEDGNEIIFKLDKIKFISVNNKCYIEIIEPIIKKSKKVLKENIPLFNFDIFQFVNTYDDIVFNSNKKDLFSIILKVKQIEQSNKCEYKFYDLNDIFLILLK